MSQKALTRNRRSGKAVALRVASPLVLAAVLAVALDAPANAATAPQATAMPAVKASAQHLTQGFDIHNVSSSTITLFSIDSPGAADGTPRIGTVLRPGESLRYEKVWWFGKTPVTSLFFTTETPGKDAHQLTLELKIDDIANVPAISTWTEVPHLEIQGLGKGSKVATIVDKPGGGPVVVSDADMQRQADLLNRLCQNGQAACTFAPTRSEPGPDMVFEKAAAENRDSEPYPYKRTETTTFTSTTNLELSATAKATLLGLIETTLSGKYSNGNSQSTTVSETIEKMVLPGKRLIVEVRQPTIRETGTFTVRMGNTRWELTNVHFDIPDPKRGAIWNPHHVDL